MILIRQTLAIVTLLMLLMAPPALAAATTNDKFFNACDANSKTKNSAICKDRDTTENPVVHIIKVAANLIALIAGVAAVILIIVSGLTMAASAGNQEAVTNSRKRIMSAVIGLIVIALAWAITRFVTDKLVQ